MIDIIPAIDIIDGKCVRLTNGDFGRKAVYSDDPAEIAKRFGDAGLRRLHIVDLDGARTGTPANFGVLESLAGCGLTIDFGGGIRTDKDIAAVFDAGAAIANIGSIAFREPDKFFEWKDIFGAERLLLGADTRDGRVTIDGWQTSTDVPIFSFLRMFAERGLTAAFVTDVGSDGAMAGPAFRLYREIVGSVGEIRLIASGGVRSIDDLAELESIGCAGVIIGKAIYEGKITLEELTEYAGKADHSMP